MVINYNDYYLALGMKREMTIEYLKCIADLNLDVDFRVNGAIVRL